MSILVVGSIAYDSVETPYGKAENALGGSGLYFSAAASLFSPVNVVGVIGSDFDTNALDFLIKRNVNFDGLYTESGETFRWGGRYHSNMNQRDTLYTYLNVFENFQPVIPNQYKNSKYVFLANIDPELQLDVLNQMNNPDLVVLDTMNFWISGKHEELNRVIKKVNILIINDEELQEFTGEHNIYKAAKSIQKMGPAHLVIKRGEYGALLCSKDQLFFAPAYPLEKVVDPTGAGDSFAGGFVGYLASEKKLSPAILKKAIIYGSAAASFTVEDFSLNNLINLTKNDLDERLDFFRKLVSID